MLLFFRRVGWFTEPGVFNIQETQLCINLLDLTISQFTRLRVRVRARVSSRSFLEDDHECQNMLVVKVLLVTDLWQWETAELERAKDRMREEIWSRWRLQSGWKWRWAQTCLTHFFVWMTDLLHRPTWPIYSALLWFNSPSLRSVQQRTSVFIKQQKHFLQFHSYGSLCALPKLSTVGTRPKMTNMAVMPE